MVDVCQRLVLYADNNGLYFGTHFCTEMSVFYDNGPYYFDL